MKHFFLIQQYLLYLVRAKTAHGAHSPFVFNFIEQILKDKRHFYAFDEIQQLREDLYANTSVLLVEDFGAGSHHAQKNERVIASIAKQAGRSKKLGELLFRMVQYFQCHSILELGTSLGLSTCYLSAANPKSKVVTIEGSESIANVASANFKRMGYSNIHLKVGNIDTVLPTLSANTFDFIFLDGNHRKAPTMRYFMECLSYITDQSILVFDDIHWSKEMLEAWEEIKEHKAVTLSIDLFFFGIVFFRKEIKVKQHFTLYY